MNRSEKIAQNLITQVLPGAQVIYMEEQSNSVHDLDITLKSGQRIGVEVTQSISPQVRDTEAALRKHDYFVDTQRCQQSWLVEVAAGAKIKKVRSLVDSYLANIEAEGLSSFLFETDAQQIPAVMKIFEDLRVESGSVTTWKTGKAIGLTGVGVGTVVDANNVNAAVEAEAHKPDNMHKLRSLQSGERHLFVYIDRSSYDAWAPLNQSEPPTATPALPPEVDSVWVAARLAGSNTYRVWKSDRGQPWSDLENVKVVLP